HKDSTFIQEEAIKMMTIHGAKGLGFKYVIYLDIDAHKPAPISKILYDYEGIYLKRIRLDNIPEARDSALESLVQETKQREDGEEHNILYVACTRAKEGLYIFANTQSYSALTLNLSSQDNRGEPLSEKNILQKTNENFLTQPLTDAAEIPNGKQLPSMTYHQEIANHYSTIIFTLPFVKSTQDEFLRHEEISYAISTDMKHKQIIGIISHLSLELMLGYKMQSIMPVLFAQYGFYIPQDKLDKIIQKVQHLFEGDLHNILDLKNCKIKCECSFLRQDNTMQRLDALLKQGDTFCILEFKSTEKLNETLMREHTLQVESYKNFIAKLAAQSLFPLTIKGYIIYLQDNIVFKEIISQES
ncbi:3'-5' exonuclease, partial [Helicobacter sp. MIT 14-3879]|uniref:3'-5' exonuclease n=1 Tax=Helicobacter sp. MIT 14-3879 TaxID=2040649 RepID=UPI000E399F80